MRFILIVVVLATLVACKNQNTAEENREVAATTSPASTAEDQLLDEVQKQTISYFWEGANKDSGLAPERIHLDGIYPSDDKNIVTIGGTGFGLHSIC